MRHHIRTLLPPLGLILASPALAQEQPDAIPDAIIVTGHGLDSPTGDAAYSVVTIERGRLSQNASGRLEDVLRDAAGIAQFRRSDSRSAHPTSQSLTLRGLGGNASSRALLLLDGVPQADPFGGWVAFPAYLPERLSSARILRGGGSGYAGPGALAGTIALSSVGPQDVGLLDARISYGSRNSWDGRAVATSRHGGGFTMLAAQYASGDGFVPVRAQDRGPVDRAAPYQQGSVALRNVASLGGTELQTSLSAFAENRDRGVDFTAVESKGVDASIRLVHRGTWGWSLLAYLQTREFSSSFASIDAARTTATQSLDQFNVPATGIGARLEIAPPLGDLNLRLGADIRSVSGKTQELFSFAAGAPTRMRVAGGSSLNFGGFADASWAHSGLTLSAGGRIDQWEISGGTLREVLLSGGAPLTQVDYVDRTGSQATGRFGIAYADAWLTLRGAAYRGWRLPTLNELYRPFRAGADATAANAELSPETLSGFEAGIDLRPTPTMSLRATAFWNRLEDGIANVTIARGPGTFPGVGFVSAAGIYRQRQNIPRLDAAGIEVDSTLSLGKFRALASYAYVDARIGTLQPAQTASHHASLTLAYSELSVTGRYVGPQFEDDLNQRRLRGAFTLDASAALPLTDTFSIEARAENLTDAVVEAGISGPGVIERASPRTLWLGLRLRLD